MGGWRTRKAQGRRHRPGERGKSGKSAEAAGQGRGRVQEGSAGPPGSPRAGLGRTRGPHPRAGLRSFTHGFRGLSVCVTSRGKDAARTQTFLRRIQQPQHIRNSPGCCGGKVSHSAETSRLRGTRGGGLTGTGSRTWAEVDGLG